MIPDGDLFGVAKVHHSTECKTIRIAESSVMDSWKGHRSRRTGKFYKLKVCVHEYRKVVSKERQVVPEGYGDGYDG